MRFVLLTALRETRSAWKRLVFFFVCIAIGVGAIVALRSVIQSVRGVLSTEARTLIAADILLWTDRPWQKGTTERIASRVAGIPGSSRIESIEMPTMARPVDEKRRHHEGRRASGRPTWISVLRKPDAAGRAAILAWHAREQRRPRAAGTAGTARIEGRRRHRDRSFTICRSWRDCDRAGPIAQRIQPGAEGAHRLRRSSGNRASSPLAAA